MAKFSIETYFPDDDIKIGTAYIFSNDKFENNKERLGNEKDLDALKDCLPKLGFLRIEVFRNKDLSGAHGELKKISMNELTAKSSRCLLIIFLSHGSLGEVTMYDESITLKQIMNPFSLNKNKLWKEIPKLFLFQVCRKGKGGMLTVEETDVEDEVIIEELDGGVSSYDVPSGSNTFIGFATSPGFVSFRSQGKGSRYIQTFATIANDYVSKYKEKDYVDFLDLMLCVSAEVSKIKTADWKEKLEAKASGQSTPDKSHDNQPEKIKQHENIQKDSKNSLSLVKKQLPWFSATLTKKLKFPKCPIGIAKEAKIIDDQENTSKTNPIASASGDNETDQPEWYTKVELQKNVLKN